MKPPRIPEGMRGLLLSAGFGVFRVVIVGFQRNAVSEANAEQGRQSDCNTDADLAVGAAFLQQLAEIGKDVAASAFQVREDLFHGCLRFVEFA